MIGIFILFILLKKGELKLWLVNNVVIFLVNIGIDNNIKNVVIKID